MHDRSAQVSESSVSGTPHTTPRKDAVLVIGETIIDIIRRDNSTSAHPGGSPANVAYGLGLLEQPIALLTQLGADANGNLAREHLEWAGVDIVPNRPTARTATSSAMLDRHGGTTYEFDIEWTLPRVDLPETPSHVHVGSIAALLAPGADSVEELLRSVSPEVTASFDPNVRPGILRDHGDALARIERLIQLSDVVKASAEDVAWIYPDVPGEVVAKGWLQTGPAMVVITKGSEGSLIATRDQQLYVFPAHSKVTDTVGAGDSFMAALLDSMIRTKLLGRGRRSRLRSVGARELQRIAQRASTAAGITVSRAGANPPSRRELEAALANEVR